MNPRIVPVASMCPFVTVIFFWEQFAKCLHTTVSQLSGKHNLHIFCVFMRSNLLPYYFWKFYFLFLYYTKIMDFWILGKYSCLLCMVSWKIIYFDLIKNLNFMESRCWLKFSYFKDLTQSVIFSTHKWVGY